MKSLFLILALSSSAPAFAAAVNMDPQPESQSLDCQAMKHELGMLHELRMTTLKDRDGVSVQAMTFVEKVAFSRGEPELSELSQQSQDKDSATFGDAKLTAVMKKADMSVDVYQGAQLAYQCR